MAYIAANTLQVTAIQAPVEPRPAPQTANLSPPTGEATPQTHAHAYIS